MNSDRDTIFALSSGRPPAAIGIVRISGPKSRFGLETMIGRVPAPRRASLARVRDPQSGEIIDQALALYFPAPHSETGEDMAELHLHGGRATIAATLAALGRLEGFRPAEAGEFTRRAFENGRLDLTAVEGLADLIGAETEVQRRQAYRQMRGGLGERAEAWRCLLIEALALVEAGIDFSDEGDVPAELTKPALARAGQLAAEIAAVLADAGRGERLREGLVVAIAGPPNAGKSTLLNRLARRDVAIVSPFAGTTRDVIEVHLDLEGYPVTLLDTAGIRETADPVEQEGVRRAEQRAGEADLVLWVVEAAQWPSSKDDKPLSYKSAAELWVVPNKIDLLGALDGRNESRNDIESRFISYPISATNGQGLNELLAALGAFAGRFLGTGESSLITRQRHRQALSETLAALERAQSEGAAGREDLLAEELRLASRSLGRLVGKVDVEAILDTIFRDFCIGK